MSISVDISKFHKYNLTDTCVIWNLLSSQRLYGCAIESGVTFYCSFYVIYESIHKPRKTWSKAEKELLERLIANRRKNQFQAYSLDLEDLQDLEVLEKRKNLGKGELSSIVLAKKYKQAFMTDDKKARKLAETILPKERVQTTPHLLGWLFYEGYLNDSDHQIIVDEHIKMERLLSEHFTNIYRHTMQLRLMQYHKG
ncbi:MAG: hypothetical protein C4527_26920 [Candidatus Omnitrophota bacterium]|nr:MAG: hypothetical protein C4527_26920 [Candidatus Omnitrophota bacterium]